MFAVGLGFMEGFHVLGMASGDSSVLGPAGGRRQWRLLHITVIKYSHALTFTTHAIVYWKNEFK